MLVKASKINRKSISKKKKNPDSSFLFLFDYSSILNICINKISKYKNFFKLKQKISLDLRRAIAIVVYVSRELDSM